MSNETNDRNDTNGHPDAHYWFWGWMAVLSVIAMCAMTWLLLGYQKADLLKDLLLFAGGLVGGVGATLVGGYRK